MARLLLGKDSVLDEPTTSGDLVNLDDDILEHPKFIRAAKLGGSGAIHLWLGLRAYCGQRLSDGSVPADMLDEVRGPVGRDRARAFDALHSVGLIRVAADGSVTMHDYLDHAPSRDAAIAKRVSARERQAKSRRLSQRDIQRDSHSDYERDSGVTHTDGADPVSPLTLPPLEITSPDQGFSGISPEVSSLSEASGSRPESKRARGRSPETEAPEKLEPTVRQIQIALERGIDLAAEVERCLAYHRSKGNRFRSWSQVLTTWLLGPYPKVLLNRQQNTQTLNFEQVKARAERLAREEQEMERRNAAQ